MGRRGEEERHVDNNNWCLGAEHFTFGREVVSIVAGAINVSSIRRFSSATVRVFVGVELLRFFRAGDGVPFVWCATDEEPNSIYKLVVLNNDILINKLIKSLNYSFKTKSKITNNSKTINVKILKYIEYMTTKVLSAK